MPLGAHERAPAPPGRLRPPRAHRRRQSPANCASRPLSPAARSCLSRRAAPQRPSDACVAVGRPSSSRGAYAAAAWAVNGSLPRTLAGRSARARGRRGRVENYCLPRATLTVLLGGLTGRYTRRRWRKSGASCCRLSGQMPRTKGASEEARGRRWTRRIRRWRARGVQQWKELSCYIQHRRHRSAQPFSRAASGSRPSGCPP